MFALSGKSVNKLLWQVLTQVWSVMCAVCRRRDSTILAQLSI
ncbi:uncharacterized protein DEA37_0012038 [Paragonimus westermani]|uniref:Uncharacterized protein n=1 Tax=Paragonimus westermani TaxID=34504 RepID=A0A5J4NVR3_9TREM|nr:uncharacterized protein DEA37_0012038 [Paragonimus westermani]